jgi:molybdenum cofactor cytidylyltransferase
MIFAIVPACGRSERMGRPKLSLPLAGRTVLEWVVTALRQGGVEKVVVVLGPHVRDLKPLAERAGAAVCWGAEPTPDMRATVQLGLGWLWDCFGAGDTDDRKDVWLLAPADHPTLDSDVVRRLCAAHAITPEYSIVVPTYQGRRGHPTLIDWSLVGGIYRHPPGQGLNTYLRLHADRTLELPVETPEILRDLDTPEDYERLLKEFRPLPPAEKDEG